MLCVSTAHLVYSLYNFFKSVFILFIVQMDLKVRDNCAFCGISVSSSPLIQFSRVLSLQHSANVCMGKGVCVLVQ